MAGIKHLKEFQEDALRGLVDETLQETEPTFADKYLPNANVYSNTFAYDIIKKSKHIGAMIGYGAEPPVVDRDAVARMSGEIAKMGLKYIATEEELLSIHQARNNAEKQDVVDRLLVKGIDLVQALQRRVNIIKIEALTKGNFAYNKNGVKVGVDFGIPAEHKVTLTNPNDWTDVNRDIIGDLLGWVATYEATNGKAPDEILISREVQANMLKNANIVVEAGRPTGSTRVSQAELDEVLNGFGLPPVRVVPNRKVTVKNIYTGADEVIEFFPSNRVVMLSEGIGNFLLGPTVENNFQPGFALQAYDKQEPIESVLRAVTAGFPAIEAPELIFHADVIPAV
jgi:hypothetical protein